MKSKQDKLDYLHSISKEVELHALLEELLPEMGFEDVKVTHEKGNKPEFGKDIVCSRHDKLENKKDWYAFVVKKGTIAGNASAVREIQDQVYECFKYPYKSIEQKKKIPINKVKVVTNQHFSSGAKEKVFESNPDDRANVDFWDDERLIAFIDEYYPKFWVKGSKQYKKYIERLQERIKVDSLVKSLSLNNKKVERILNNAIEPRLSERITNEDGSIKMVQKSANTIISIPDNSIIIGEPGAGKSTLFKTLSNEIITQNSLRNNQDFYPIILTFKEIEQSDFNIEKAIENFFNREWNSDLLIDWKNIIQTESCAIFIDALDELPVISSKEKALESLKAFREEHPNIKIICSSRPSDYLFHNCETIGFRYLEIEQLNGRQVQQFLNNYFGEDIIKSKSLLKSLKDSAILEKLPKTPLTIALITILFDEKEVEIPATITDLYEMFVNLLIGKTEPKDNVELIEIGIKHRLLCHIAKHLHTNLIQKLTRQELFDVLLQYSTERGQPLDIDKIIDELLDQVGLLFINSKGEIAFKHQSFQEYFTAYEIFHHRQSDRKLFINNFNDLWWQNVAIFYAGMTKDAPTLLDEILEASEPKNLSELISNTGGVGKLLQALFNTPIEQRKKGVLRGVENTNKSIEHIIEIDSKETEFWKNFSKYGLMQIFGGWFKHNFWSITLNEPLKQQFDDLLPLISKEELKPEERFRVEYNLFLISAILASDDFRKFEPLRQLVEIAKLNDLELLATVDTHLKMLHKFIPEHFKTDEDLKKVIKKIKKRIQVIPEFADKVNTPLKKLIKPATNSGLA